MDAMNETYNLISNVRDNILKAFLLYVFDKIWNRFFTLPAARKKHGTFEGGLAYHSVLSAKIAFDAVNNLNYAGKKINRDLVIAGILLHDIGKIKCYEWENERTDKHGKIISEGYQHTKDSELLGHVTISYSIVNDLIKEFNASREKEEHKINEKKAKKLLHCILASHGQLKWGSPVSPKFTEAYIVHAIECFESYVDKFYNNGSFKLYE